MTYERDGYDQSTKPASARDNEVVQFDPNVPVQLVTKFKNPKIIHTTRGMRAMVTLTNKRVAFLDRDTAAKIEMLGIKPGEAFWICRRVSGEKGALEQWDVYLDPATERARAAAESPAPAPQGPTVVEKPVQAAGAAQPWWQSLLGLADNLIDVYAAALAHSQKHGGAVRNEDVRALVITAFIEKCKRTSHAA